MYYNWGYSISNALGIWYFVCVYNFIENPFGSFLDLLQITPDNIHFCDCDTGYIGSLCEDEINECHLLDPCMNGAICKVRRVWLCVHYYCMNNYASIISNNIVAVGLV